MRKLIPLITGSLLIVAACAGSPASTATRSPTATQAPASTSGPVGTPAPAAPTAGGNPPPAGAAMCATLTADDVSGATGKPAFVVADQSSETNCTFNVGGADVLEADYVLDFRSEDGDLSGPKIAFAGGEDVSGIGDGAYWSPLAEALWFTRGGQTYALQFILFGDDDGDALAIARQLAQAALGRL